MSSQNPANIFFSPENVTKLYKTIQIYLKQNHNVDIGREYLEQLIKVMKLVIKPIKKVPKNVDKDKFVLTLNKRVLSEAIPIFSEIAESSTLSHTLAGKIGKADGNQTTINTQGMTNPSKNALRAARMMPPRPETLLSETNRGIVPDTLATPITQLKANASLPPSASMPSDDPTVIAQTMNEARLQDPRLFNNPDELFDLINQQRQTQENFKPPQPQFQEPEVEYPDNIDDLYAQAENARESSDVLPPPTVGDVKQLPFELQETFQVRQAPTSYSSKARGAVEQAIESHNPTVEHFGVPQSKALVPMDTTDYQMSTTLEELQRRGTKNTESYTAGTIIHRPDNAPVHGLDDSANGTFDPAQFRDMVPRVDRSLQYPRDVHDFTNLATGMNSFSDIAPQPQQMRVLIPETSRNLTNDSRIIPVTVSIDSRNKDEEENDNAYRIDIDEVRDVLAMELVDAQIPITEYIINDTNNVIYFEEVDGTTLIAEVPPGNYDATTLATRIEDAMNSATGATVTYSVVADPNTEKFVISSTNGMAMALIFNLLFFGGVETYGATQPEFRKERATYLPNSIGPLIGFNAEDLTGDFDYTSQQRWNLNGEPYIWLFVKEAEVVSSRDPNQRKAFAKIVLDQPLGSIKYYSHKRDGTYVKHFSPPIGKLAHLTIEFRKRNGELYNFNGHTNSVTFRLVTKDITQTPY